MTTIVTRTYADAHKAGEAVSQLLAHGLRPDEVNQIAQGTGAVVTAHARFGLAAATIKIMDGCGPLAGSAAHGEVFAKAPMDPTPFSNFMNWDTLSNSRTPFSKFWGISALSKNPTPLSSWLGIGTLSKSRTIFPAANLNSGSTPFSSALGWSTLSKSPTPLSSTLGMPTLSDRGHRR